jgi:hypothetical protein
MKNAMICPASCRSDRLTWMGKRFAKFQPPPYPQKIAKNKIHEGLDCAGQLNKQFEIDPVRRPAIWKGALGEA